MCHQPIRKEMKEKKNQNKEGQTTTKKILCKTKKKCQSNSEVHQIQNWFTHANTEEIKSHKPKQCRIKTFYIDSKTLALLGFTWR